MLFRLVQQDLAADPVDDERRLAAGTGDLEILRHGGESLPEGVQEVVDEIGGMLEPD
jgi:hypothetical protein